MVKLPPIINHCYLMVTEQCPLRCKYCYIKDRETPNEFDFKWMDKVKNMFTCYNKPRIIFFGGEPLVKLELIKKIVEKYNNDFQFQVVTNGCVNFHQFMDEVYEPNRNKFDVQISWDGKVDTRKTFGQTSTYNNVYKSIEKELRKGRILIGRAVLNEESVKTFYETYKTYQKLNREYKFGGDFTIAHQLHFLDSFAIDLKEQLNLIYEDVKEQLLSNEKFYLPNILLKTISNMLQNKTDVISCDIGTHIVIRPNGDIYPCTILSQKDERFKLGNINSSIDTEIINDLRYGSHCQKDCKFKSICDGGCRYERIIHYPNSWKCNVCNHTCDIYKSIFESTDIFLQSLNTKQQDKLFKYLQDYNMFCIEYDNCVEVDNQKGIYDD